MSRRVAIVGCGYVGTAVGASLVTAGHDVVGTTTGMDRVVEIEAAGIRAVILDLANVDAVRALLADRDAVYLCVAAGRQRRNYEDVYLRGARHVVAAMAGSSVGRLIYTSSTGVYGRNDGGWVDEETPPEPTTENGKILLAAEGELLGGGVRLGVKVSVVRLAGIVGPGRDPAERVARVARTTRDDGDAFVNLVHRDRIVDGLTRLLGIEHHGVLNLAGSQPETRREMYDRLIAEKGLTPVVWESPAVPRLGKRVRSVRIDEVLGLSD